MKWLLNNEIERGDSLYTFVNSIPLQKVHSQTGQNLECKECLYYLLLVGKYIFVQNFERHYHFQKVLKLVKTKDYTIKQELCFVINTFLWKLEDKVIDTRQTVSFGEKLRHTHNFIHANNLYTCTIVKQKMWQRKFF